MMKRLLLMAGCALLLVMATHPALATGTEAGTVISNQAYADYQDANGNDLTRIYSNTVTTTVSQVAGVDLSPAAETVAGANTPTEGDTVYFPVDIVNTGNGDDVFDFTYNVDSGWTPTDVSFFFDVNGNGIYDDGTDTEIVDTAATYTTGAVGSDDSYPIIMAVTIPDSGTAADGSTSVITVEAVSQLDGAVTDTGTYTAQVASAVIQSVKTHSPESPVPGDTVTYTITLTNNGSIDGDVALVNDTIPANVTYVAGSITLDTVSKTDADDLDNADYNVTVANAVYVDVGTITSGGGQVVITFQSTVNDGVPSGTHIVNQANVNYESNGIPVAATTNGQTFIVAGDPAVTVTETTASSSADPSDQVVYPFTITNDGNLTDTFDLTYTSTAGWTWDFWLDSNGDGIPGNDGDVLLTDTDGDGVIDTGPVTQGSTENLLAVATVPAGTSDGTVDSMTLTATSSDDTDISDTGTFTTTVTAPVLSLTKTVSPTGNQPPGTELVYTLEVTNSGTGVATDVVVTDSVPQYTTYKAGTLETGSSLATLVTRTDDDDGDGGTFDGTNKRVVVGSGTTLNIGPGGKLFAQFTVTID